MQAGGKRAEISPRIEVWVGLRNPYVHPNMDNYSRKHKNGDVSVPCWSLKTVMCARSVQQKMENERELSTATNGVNDCVNCR